mmetsp:Transcript_41997/g.49064  ORF Transcript_41997/g.49064 Transcript_41997/m.49064 type:complete len:701 (-) Transcript_41997:397-2499(-)
MANLKMIFLYYRVSALFLIKLVLWNDAFPHDPSSGRNSNHGMMFATAFLPGSSILNTMIPAASCDSHKKNRPSYSYNQLYCSIQKSSTTALSSTVTAPSILNKPTTNTKPTIEINEGVTKSDTHAQSDVQLLIRNIDWTISTEHVLGYLANVTHGIDVTIHLKPIRSHKQRAKLKPRDVGKHHGGSAKLLFGNRGDATIAMDRFRVSDGSMTSIGTICAQWAIVPQQQQERDISPTSSSPAISSERIVHRQKRAEKYARTRRTIGEKTDTAIQSLNDILRSDPRNNHWMLPSVTLDVVPLDWSDSSIPATIDPCRGGGLKAGTERGERKRAQVEAFLHVLREGLLCDADADPKSPRVVADLGCGAGNLSLPLAWFLNADPKYRVLAVDINRRALERLRSRAKDVSIAIETMEEDLLHLGLAGGDEGSETFANRKHLDSCAAVVSLHACGAASDLAMEAAVSRSIPFAISPCCIGKVKAVRSTAMISPPSTVVNDTQALPSMLSVLGSKQRSAAPERITYPRSNALFNIIHDTDDYALLLSAADYSAAAVNSRGAIDRSEQEIRQERRGKAAKNIVEMDRLQWAAEQGYDVRMVEIPRLGTFYPKRHLLLGAKSGSLSAFKLSQLSTTAAATTSTTRLFSRNTDEENEGVQTDNDSDDVTTATEDRMDLGGFAGYLAPYVLAFVLSIAATAAFFKFVLLDY